jgi:flagellar biogenesis protein FliO
LAPAIAGPTNQLEGTVSIVAILVVIILVLLVIYLFQRVR